MQRNPHSYQIATGYRTFYSLSLIYQPITKKRLFFDKKYYDFKYSLQKKLYICSVFHDIDHEWHTSSVRTMSIYNDKNYIDNVINLNLIKKTKQNDKE